MKKKNVIRYFLVMGAIMIVFLLFSQTHRFVVVSGESMLPSMYDGDVVVATKTSMIVPGDVYLLKEPDEDTLVIKRLIGIPGDKIELKDGATLRNGIQIMEAPGDSWDNIVFELGANEYLFIGDNRGKSYDGRFWSRFVHLDEIICHLDWTLYPFSSFGKVEGLHE